MENNRRIAIIGTGISGLTCGYYLTKEGVSVTMYEASDYIGGHTHTVATECEGEHAMIDTGFIVFNDRTYPNFISLMDEIGVAYQPTEMSFSVRNDEAGVEYNGSSLNGIFAQRSNLVKPSFFRMLKDIVRFNKEVREYARTDPAMTIGAYLDRSDYAPAFSENYLMPMIAAIWSMGTGDCRDFPLAFFVKFFSNHGLLDLTNRPQWYTIRGGSSSYIEPLTRSFRQGIVLSTPVRKVRRSSDGVEVLTDNGSDRYDQVVLACHGDEALVLLDEPSEDEQQVLSNFRFSRNRVVLHTDVSHMPRSKRAWASWNYRVAGDTQDSSTLTYNMNILQRLETKHTYLVTLNQDVDPACVIREFDYSHPVYTVSMIDAQERWHQISGVDGIHYCGAYWFNGFHEDGVNSGLRVCEMLGGD